MVVKTRKQSDFGAKSRPAVVPPKRAVVPFLDTFLAITVSFGKAYLRGLLPERITEFLSSFLPPIVDPIELAISLSLQWILHPFESKDRGDLDLHIHQSKSPLCEGIPLDLDLGEIWRTWCSSLFFLSYSPISFCSFVGIWEWRICHLHLVHWFELSTKIHGSESEKLVTLGFLEP